MVLLPAHEDRDIWRYFASLAFPPEQHVRTTLRALAENGAPMSTAALETYVDLSRTRLETMLKVLDVDGAVDRVRGGWTATGQEWVYDQERYDRVAAARRDEQAAMLAYVATDGCRMRFLREQLDDPGAEDCGRCDNCGGLDPPRPRSPVPPWRRPASGSAGRASRSRRARCGRPRWPTSASTSRARSPKAAEEGRAVGRLTDLGHGQLLRALFRPDAEDGPVPRPLVDAVLEVLGDWHPAWPARPTGVAYVESARRPQLTRDLAEGLARYLKLPLVARWQIVDPDVPPGRGAANSAQRVAAVAPPVPPGARRAPRRRPGAARRRPRRHRLDHDPRRPGPARGRRLRRPAVDPRSRWLRSERQRASRNHVIRGSVQRTRR